MTQVKPLTNMLEEPTTLGVNVYPRVDVRGRIDKLPVGQAVLIEDLGSGFCDCYLIRRKSKRVFETIALWADKYPDTTVYTNTKGVGEGLIGARVQITEQTQKSYWLFMKQCVAKEIETWYADKYPKEFIKWLMTPNPVKRFDKSYNEIMEKEYNKIQRYATLEDMTFAELWGYAYHKEVGLYLEYYHGETPKWSLETVQSVMEMW